jgi:hypothetical protein
MGRQIATHELPSVAARRRVIQQDSGRAAPRFHLHEEPLDPVLTGEDREPMLDVVVVGYVRARPARRVRVQDLVLGAAERRIARPSGGRRRPAERPGAPVLGDQELAPRARLRELRVELSGARPGRPGR